jgi:putative transposase
MPATNAASTGEKKIKGRKRHIITDTLGHLLGVIVHAANLSDTVEGQRICLQVADRYPSIQAFLADQGYRGTTVAFAEEWLNRRVDIAEKATSGFQIQPKRWIVERTLAWLGNWRRLAKDFEIRTETAENMIRIAMLKITVAKCAKL